MLSLLLLDATHWVQEMASAVDMNIPKALAMGRIQPFLLEDPNRPEADIRRERRNMLRNMIRNELQRANGRDPGNNLVDIEQLEAAWRVPITSMRASTDMENDNVMVE